MNDHRLTLLQRWLEDELGFSDYRLTPASGDASFRRYFRVTRESGSKIVMDAPPDKEDIAPFLHVASLLGALDLNVPAVLAEDRAQGFLLLSDLGSRTYLEALEGGANFEALYADALGSLVRMQSMDAAAAGSLPPYDAALLAREMGLFRDWLCERHLGFSLVGSQAEALEQTFAFLSDAALEQPRVFVHRDYHSRNLMQTEARNPGILDFQDAVHGPVTYDLISLLRDCYVAWPAGRVREWALDYRERAAACEIPVGHDAAGFLRWFDLMGVQRHLKAAGIFARLKHRDGKPGYLADVPRTLGYVVAVAAGYPELAFLGELVATRVLPALATGMRDVSACGR
ncbi:MAG: phosphotransferase [Gammaproteobacteria bacterium]|nr:phosphotransferase [Gammaproteobacteria bacterium]